MPSLSDKPSRSPAGVLSLQIPCWHIHHQCEHESQLVANIAALVPNHGRQGTHIPRLIHTHDAARDAARECQAASIAGGKSGRVVPCLQVIPLKAMQATTVEVMLGAENYKEGRVPVAQ